MTNELLDKISEIGVLQPGDVLVVRCGEHATQADLEQLKARLDDLLPLTVKSVVLGGSIELHVLRAGEVTPT